MIQKLNLSIQKIFNVSKICAMEEIKMKLKYIVAKYLESVKYSLKQKKAFRPFFLGGDGGN